MGRLSLEQLVWTIDKDIERFQVEAREKVLRAVRKAKTEDPAFFDIPYNPFSAEETDSDEEGEDEEEEGDEDKSVRWFSGLKASNSPAAKEILKIRKDLYKNVQNSLDDFKSLTSPLITISPTSVFSSLYCRLLQLENIF